MSAPRAKSTEKFSSFAEEMDGEEVQPQTPTLEDSKEAKAMSLSKKAGTENKACICHLPPELIIQIYTHLPTIPAITALNRTSRSFYEIWHENAATISGAVLSRSIDCYDSLLELVQLENRFRAMARAGREASAIPDTLLENRKQAHGQASEAGSRSDGDSSPSRQRFREALAQNVTLIRKKQMASAVHSAYEEAAGQKRRAKLANGRNRLADRRDIIAAYYGVWKIATLGSRTAQNERVTMSSEQDFTAMTEMANFLTTECPIGLKVALGIVRREFRTSRLNARLAGGISYEYEVKWRNALIEISMASGHGDAASLVRVLRPRCH